MKCIIQKEYPDNTESFPLYPRKETYIILKKKTKLKEEKWKGMNLAINYLGNFNQNSKFGMATKKLSMSELLEIYGNRKIIIPLFKNNTLKKKMKAKFLNSSFREIILPSKPNESQQYINDNSEEMGDVFSFNDEISINNSSNTNHNNHSNNYCNEKKLTFINSTNNLSFQEQLYTNGSGSLFHKIGFGTHFKQISLNKFTKNNMLKSKCSIVRETLPIFPVIYKKRKTNNNNKGGNLSLLNNINNKLIIRHQPVKLKQSSFSLLNQTCKLD